MHFYNLIENLAKNKEIILFVDIDGVIASYDVGKPLNFLEKRPLSENIKKIEEVSKIPNVTVNILSICRKNFQIEEKNIWLDKYAPFFEKENRKIISKEEYGESAAELKAGFLSNVKTNKQKILLDDDNLVLKYIMKNVKDIIVFQDSELID